MFTAVGQPETWTSGAIIADVANEYISPALCATSTYRCAVPSGEDIDCCHLHTPITRAAAKMRTFPCESLHVSKK